MNEYPILFNGEMVRAITDALSKADHCAAMEAAAEHLAQECGEKTLRIRELEAELANLRAQLAASEFWSEIACPEGMTAKDVQNELTDFHRALENVGKVYCHITGSKISKINTLAAAVIDAADEHYSALAADDTKELGVELAEARKALEPFAAFSGIYSPSMDGSHIVVLDSLNCAGITVGDLRRAAAELAKAQGGAS